MIGEQDKKSSYRITYCLSINPFTHKLMPHNGNIEVESLAYLATSARLLACSAISESSL